VSYPKDLEDYTDQQLLEEILRRAKLRADGVCDYCGSPATKPTCAHVYRHKLAAAGRKT
jgi:hypothetical protein